MDYKVLYRKYRPQDFDSIVGQEYTIKLLKNSIKENKISHAYIFTGPRGTGKTSTAKIFSKAINCTNSKDGNPCNKCDICKSSNENPDIIEIDAASNNSVDDVRELIENSRLATSISKYKVYIIDEFHMLSTSAFNALLLTLEEPPKNVVFILATTDIQSVPITVLSRCQRFDFKPISNEDIVNRLKYVCDKEKISIDEEAIKEIAYMSNGGLRDALSILDQVAATNNKITVDDIINNFGSVSTKKIDELVKNIANNDVSNIIENINKFRNSGVDYRILSVKLIEALKDELINLRMGKSKYEFEFNNIYDLILEISNSISSYKSSIDPYIFIEITILKYINVSRETLNTSSKIELNQDEINVNKNIIEENNNIDTNNNTNKCSYNLDIRVNNCFANAKRKYLDEIKTKWDDFLIYESNANKKIMSYIVDTDIVASSDKYSILTNNLASTAELINENIESLEQDFKIFYGLEHKFICLSQKKWEECKEKYVFNIKNNVKYSIIDEVEENSKSDVDKQEMDNNDELEKLAAEIFEDNVEIR
ncbi:MAG: DNA polymerase III subunit gamma/tau [Bacilli bacterium]|nr:DNA polymerase III subunit gamma/tau [Bacilli bacterium]